MTINTSANPGDPLEFIKNMWGNMGFTLPGMVAPTVDTDELGKRIADLKSVEGWLKSNLSLLQMTIQGLEMQRATLMAFQQMSQATQEAAKEAESVPNPFLNPALWQMPWDAMSNAMQSAAAAAPTAVTPAPGSAPQADQTETTPKRSTRKKTDPGKP
jgi:hypothetical protein